MLTAREVIWSRDAVLGFATTVEARLRGTTRYSALGFSFNSQLKRLASSCIGA